MNKVQTLILLRIMKPRIMIKMKFKRLTNHMTLNKLIKKRKNLRIIIMNKIKIICQHWRG